MLSAKKVEVELNMRMKRAQKGKEKAEGGKNDSQWKQSL